MKTNPAHFGQNVELLCHEKYSRSKDGIQDTPQKQWFGGVNYSLLCTDSVSSNDKKFVCKCGRTDDYDFSVLTIKNFSTRDVNIPYKCLFGFSSSDLILELSETKFEYQPIESLPTSVTVHSCTNIDLKFRFAKVFPEPICSGKYGLKNITNEIQVDSMIFEKLYRSNIRMTLNNVVDIEGNSIQLLSIKCIIGGHEHTLVSQHISCRDKDYRRCRTRANREAFTGKLEHGDEHSNNLAKTIGSSASIVSGIVKKVSSVILGQKTNHGESQALQNEESCVDAVLSEGLALETVNI